MQAASGSHGARYWIAIVLLAALAVLGITDTVSQAEHATTPGTVLQSVAEFGYGLLSAAVILTAFRFRTLARAIRFAWLATLTMAGGLAPVVWGGTGPAAGLLAGVVSLGVGLAILWMLRTGD